VGETLADAANAIVDDSFLRCFTSAPPDPWNWNVYLFPMWCAGVVCRYLILFPARLAFLALAQGLFFLAFTPVQLCLRVRRGGAMWAAARAVQG